MTTTILYGDKKETKSIESYRDKLVIANSLDFSTLPSVDSRCRL